MKKLSLSSVLFLVILLTTFVSAADIRVLMGRPGETNNTEDRKFAWYSAIMDGYMHFRFIELPGANSVSSDSVAAYFKSRGKYGIKLSKGQLGSATQTFGATHILKMNYLVNSRDKSVMLNVFLYKKGKAAPLLEYTTQYPIISTSTYLDSAVLKIATALDIPVDPDKESRVLAPILMSDYGLMEKLGKSVVTVSEAKRSKDLDKELAAIKAIRSDNRNFWLAHFMAGMTYERQGLFEDGSVAFKQLTDKKQFKLSGMFTHAIRNFRLIKNYKMADKLLNKARKIDLATTELTLELAKLRVAQERESEAVVAFNKVLKESSEDGDALLFMAKYNNRSKKFKSALGQSELLIKLAKTTDQALLQKGIALVGLKKVDEAIVALKLAIKNRGDQSAAHLLLADLYEGKKVYDSSAASLASALRTITTDPDLLIRTSQMYKKSGDNNEAVKVLENYSSNFTGNLKVEAELGLTYFSVKDTGRSLLSLEKCIAMDPQSKEVFLTLSAIYFDKSSWRKMITVNEKVRPLVKDKLPVDFTIGYGHYQLKEFAKSEEAFRKVISVKSTYPEANRYIGEILFGRKDFTASLAFFKREKRANGNTVNLQEKILSANYQLKKYTAARADANGLIKLDSLSGFAYSHLALISLKEKKYGEAKRHLEQAALLGSVNPGVYLSLGRGFASAKQYSEAIIAYNKYIGYKPNADIAHLEVAVNYKKNKQPEKAVASYLKANEINPTKNRHALADAGNILFDKNDLVRAEGLYSKFILAGGLDDKIFHNYGVIKFGKKEYAEVIASLDKITGPTKKDPAVIKLYGQSKYLINAYGEALPFLVQAFKYDSSSVELAEMTAISYEKTSNYSAAAKYYEKVTSMGGKTKQKQYGFHLAGIYEKLGQNEQAMIQYKMNIKRFPKMYENHEALASHYLKRKEFTNAITLLSPAIRVGAPSSLNKPLAIAYRKLNDNGNAAKAYERYVLKVTTDSTAWSELGKIYYDMKKYGKAIRPFTKASALMPKDKWIHYKLASSYMHLKKASSAQTVLVKVWPSYRTDKDIQKIYSAVLSVTKDTLAMIDVYTQRSKLELKNFSLNVTLGNLLVSKSRVDDGIKSYERALAIKADAFKVRQTLITHYTKINNDTIVYRLVQDGLRLHPNSAVLYQQRAAYYLRGKELTKAKNDLKKSVSLNSNNGPAYFTLGMVYKELKELGNARSSLKKATSIEPKNSEYRIELSRVLVTLNRLKEAIAEGEVILTLVPKDYRAISEVATIFDKAKKYNRAEKLYLKALSINKDCPICYRNLGVIYYERGSYDLAESNLDNFCKKDTTDAVPNLYLGNLKRGNGDEDYALKLFRRAHNSNPKNDEMLFRYVNMLCEVGNVAEAKQVTAKRGSSNKSAWVFVAEGRVQEATEKYKQAIALYNTGLKMNEEIGDAYLGLGRIQMSKKDFNGGIETFGRAMGYDPTNVETFILLGKVYLNLKDYRSAEGILLEGTKVNGKNPDVYYYLAMSYSRNRKHDKAVSVLRKALTYNKESANINYALAVELSEDIKPKESIKRFERTLEFDKKKEFELKIYKIMGDIYYEQLLDNAGAKIYYKKYIKAGGSDNGIKDKLKSL